MESDIVCGHAESKCTHWAPLSAVSADARIHANRQTQCFVGELNFFA